MFPRQIRGFRKITRVLEDVPGFRRPGLVELFTPIKCVELDELEAWLKEVVEGEDKSVKIDLYYFLDQIKVWKMVKR